MEERRLLLQAKTAAITAKTKLADDASVPVGSANAITAAFNQRQLAAEMASERKIREQERTLALKEEMKKREREMQTQKVREVLGLQSSLGYNSASYAGGRQMPGGLMSHDSLGIPPPPRINHGYGSPHPMHVSPHPMHYQGPYGYGQSSPWGPPAYPPYPSAYMGFHAPPPPPLPPTNMQQETAQERDEGRDEEERDEEKVAEE